MQTHAAAGKARSSEEPLFHREDAAGIALLTLDSAASRNALSLAMIDGLTRALRSIAADRSIRCVILAAKGPAFCAGHDLKELTAARSLADGGKAFFADTMSRCSAMMRAIVALPQPVIAAVEGVATAAGCQIVASCDLAVAGATARFCTPGVDIGLFCSTPAVALARNVPRKQAMEMLLTGAMIGADDALRIGLVNRVVARGGALAEARDLARAIATKSARAVSIGKKAFYEQIDLPLAEAYDRASAAMVENMLTGDAAEGIGAFIEKRAPDWRHE